MILCRSALVLFCCALFLSQAEADDRLLTHPVFEPVQTTPIFEAAPGQWDAKIRERGWVMKDGDSWKMWYTGYDPDKQPLTMKLGYATSKDGITWTRHPQNPIISDFWVEDIMVVRDNQRYLMFAEGTGDQAQLLESTDGIQWKRLGTLDVRLTNGQPIPAGPYGTPTAWFEDGVWNLFYERRDAGIWLARSTDLKVWTNVSDEPIIKPGPEPFDSLMIAMNQVIKVDGKYIAVLHGTGSPEKPRQWCTTLFESDDLLHWKKSAHNPLRPVTENKSSGVLVQNGTGWRLYTMHDKVFVHELK
jgi:sucrose-6-phosphate hydrolase SacC (GH32 family)